jgi:hypothetical protein
MTDHVEALNLGGGFSSDTGLGVVNLKKQTNLISFLFLVSSESEKN